MNTMVSVDTVLLCTHILSLAELHFKSPLTIENSRRKFVDILPKALNVTNQMKMGPDQNRWKIKISQPQPSDNIVWPFQQL